MKISFVFHHIFILVPLSSFLDFCDQEYMPFSCIPSLSVAGTCQNISFVCYGTLIILTAMFPYCSQAAVVSPCIKFLMSLSSTRPLFLPNPPIVSVFEHFVYHSQTLPPIFVADVLFLHCMPPTALTKGTKYIACQLIFAYIMSKMASVPSNVPINN